LRFFESGGDSLFAKLIARRERTVKEQNLNYLRVVVE
jgi:hypothetical protein